MKKIRVRLKEILNERNLTQLELSQSTGIRPNAISNLCRNYIDRLNIDHLERICDALNINDMAELIEITGGVEEKKIATIESEDEICYHCGEPETIAVDERNRFVCARCLVKD